MSDAETQAKLQKMQDELKADAEKISAEIDRLRSQGKKVKINKRFMKKLAKKLDVTYSFAFFDSESKKHQSKDNKDMKKILKSCSFWFGIASLLIICLNLIGQDSKNIVLAMSNYPLYAALTKSGFTLNDPFAPDHTLYFQGLFLWFSLHFISYVFYGFVIDVIRWKMVQIHK